MDFPPFYQIFLHDVLGVLVIFLSLRLTVTCIRVILHYRTLSLIHIYYLAANVLLAAGGINLLLHDWALRTWVVTIMLFSAGVFLFRLSIAKTNN